MNKKYGVILADPPWDYGNQIPFGRTADCHYPTMKLAKMKAMELPTKDNCALFLWAVWPNLDRAMALIDAWGFRYVTLGFIWVKARVTGFGFYTNQMGHYTKPNTEPCLFAVKGSVPPLDRPHSVIYHPLMKQHSRKPDDQYDRIERMYPLVHKLELFARRSHQGWDVWGNEVESDIELNPTHYETALREAANAP